MYKGKLIALNSEIFLKKAWNKYIFILNILIHQMVNYYTNSIKKTIFSTCTCIMTVPIVIIFNDSRANKVS